MPGKDTVLIDSERNCVRPKQYGIFTKKTTPEMARQGFTDKSVIMGFKGSIQLFLVVDPQNLKIFERALEAAKKEMFGD